MWLGSVFAGSVFAMALPLDAHGPGRWLTDPKTNCQIWTTLEAAERVTWTGACHDGKGHGDVVIAWHYRSRGQELTETYRGGVRADTFHGPGELAGGMHPHDRFQ